MKVVSVVALVVLTFASSQSADVARCISAPSKTFPKDWITMDSHCIQSMKAQVQVELEAAITYLHMAAHFSKDTVNRPGFAKFFFESASEEREHAVKIIKYLLMRGELKKDVNTLIQKLHPKKNVNLDTGVTALQSALELETSVTTKINDIIKNCETPPANDQGNVVNDYHLVDYLTGEFLEEQYKGQRDIAGKLVTLEKMQSAYGNLGEFLFDKKLLNQEIPVL